jgi:hypothetical protein
MNSALTLFYKILSILENIYFYFNTVKKYLIGIISSCISKLNDLDELLLAYPIIPIRIYLFHDSLQLLIIRIPKHFFQLVYVKVSSIVLRYNNSYHIKEVKSLQ